MRNKKIKKKYYEIFMEGVNTLGSEYNLYNDVVELIWELLPSNYSLENCKKRMNFAILKEIEMTTIDLLGYSKQGVGSNWTEKNWWLNGFIQDVIDQFTFEDEEFMDRYGTAFKNRELPIKIKNGNKKTKSNHAHYTFEMENLNSLKTHKGRVEKRISKVIDKEWEDRRWVDGSAGN